MKRMKEEREHEERGEDLEKKDNPLSREGWIMLLSDEINNLNMANLVLASIFFACALACLSGIFIFSSKGIVWPDWGPVILLFFALFFISLSLGHCRMTQKKVEHIERIREGIILEDEGFKTYDEIRDQCKNAEVILKKK